MSELGRVSVRYSYPSLIPVEGKKIFEWDCNVYSHSEDAMRFIEVLMACNAEIHIKTSQMDNTEERRVDIVGLRN